MRRAVLVALVAVSLLATVASGMVAPDPGMTKRLCVSTSGGEVHASVQSTPCGTFCVEDDTVRLCVAGDLAALA